MIRALTVALALGVATPTFAQTDSEYWLIGMWSSNGRESDTITFIDATRIRVTGNTRRAWDVRYLAEDAYAIRQMRSLIEYDCNGRRSRTLQSTVYYRNSAIAPQTAYNVNDWAYEVPDTGGELMLDFVCGSRSSWESGDRYIRMPVGVDLQGVADRSFARDRERR